MALASGLLIRVLIRNCKSEALVKEVTAGELLNNLAVFSGKKCRTLQHVYLFARLDLPSGVSSHFHARQKLLVFQVQKKN